MVTRGKIRRFQSGGFGEGSEKWWCIALTYNGVWSIPPKCWALSLKFAYFDDIRSDWRLRLSVRYSIILTMMLLGKVEVSNQSGFSSWLGHSWSLCLFVCLSVYWTDRLSRRFLERSSLSAINIFFVSSRLCDTYHTPLLGSLWYISVCPCSLFIYMYNFVLICVLFQSVYFVSIFSVFVYILCILRTSLWLLYCNIRVCIFYYKGIGSPEYRCTSPSKFLSTTQNVAVSWVFWSHRTTKKTRKRPRFEFRTKPCWGSAPIFQGTDPLIIKCEIVVTLLFGLAFILLTAALLAGQRTYDSQVAGSSPGWPPLRKLLVGWPNVLGTLTLKHVHLFSAVFFHICLEDRWGMDVQGGMKASTVVSNFRYAFLKQYCEWVRLG